MVDFKEKYNKLVRLFNRHAGNLGDGVHGLATDHISGFMPPDLYKVSRQRARSRTWLNDLDVLTQQPGYYTGLNMLNGPIKNVNWICDIDIYWGYDGRKNIFVYDNFGGDIYFTTVTSDSDGNKTDWRLLARPMLEIFNRGSVTNFGIGTIHKFKSDITIDWDKIHSLYWVILDTRFNLQYRFYTARSFGEGGGWNIAGSDRNFMAFTELRTTIDMQKLEFKVEDNFSGGIFLPMTDWDTQKLDSIIVESVHAVYIK